MNKNHSILILLVLLISGFDSCKKVDKISSTETQVIIDDNAFNTFLI